LDKNLKTLGIEKGREAEVHISDFSVCLDRLVGQFDVIFLDPPYRFDYGVPALEKIVKRDLLSENGVVVYERDRPFDGDVSGVEKYDERKYGKTYLTFFRRS
jgi:16S rRNA G966 N2-methylase RsmD